MTDPIVIRDRFALRRRTASEWTADNPVIAVGEEGWESDTGRRKVGDGAAWLSRPYEDPTVVVGLSNGTDDSAALAAALAAAGADGRVRLTPGQTYRAHGLTVPAGCTIDARDAGIKVPDGVTALNIFAASGAWRLIGGDFDGNKTGATDGASITTSCGVYQYAAAGWAGQVRLEARPVFHDFFSSGVHFATDLTSLTDADNAPASAAYLDHVVAYGCAKIAMRFSGITDLDLASPYAHNNTSHGIRTYLCKRPVTRNARAFNNGAHGMTSLYCVDQKTDGQFDYNGSDGHVIGGDSASTTITAGRRFQLGRIIARHNTSHGVVFDASITSSNAAVPVYGTVANVLAEYNGGGGVIVTSSQFLFFGDITADNNAGHGMEIASANVGFDKLRAQNNGQKGLALEWSAGSPNWGNHYIGHTELSGNTPDDSFTMQAGILPCYWAQATRVRRTLTNTAGAVMGETLGLDTTGGTFAVTLPEASLTRPGRIHVKWVAGTAAPTLLLTGTDKLNTSSNSTPPTFSFLNHGYTFESDGQGLWTIVADDLPVSALAVLFASLRAYKTAATTRNATTTLTADPHLTIPSIPVGTYALDAYLPYDSSTTADFAIGWNLPAGATISYTGSGIAGTSSAANAASMNQVESTSTTGPNSGGVGVGSGAVARPLGSLVVTTAGTLTLKWAQNTSDATDTTLHAGAWLRLTKLS